MDDLIAFINARLDEDERMARNLGHRTAREYKAHRAIMERYQDVVRHEAPGNQDPTEYELFILPPLAAIWSAHPDYRPEWAS